MPRAAIEALPHMCGKACFEDYVPDAAGEPVSHLHAAGSVMIGMVLSDVLEVRIAKVVEVHGLMHPLFNHIRLHHSSQQHWRRVSGTYETQRRSEREQRKQVRQLAIDMLAIKRPFVMLPMDRVHVFNQQAPVQTLPWFV